MKTFKLILPLLLTTFLVSCGGGENGVNDNESPDREGVPILEGEVHDSTKSFCFVLDDTTITPMNRTVLSASDMLQLDDDGEYQVSCYFPDTFNNGIGTAHIVIQLPPYIDISTVSVSEFSTNQNTVETFGIQIGTDTVARVSKIQIIFDISLNESDINLVQSYGVFLYDPRQATFPTTDDQFKVDHSFYLNTNDMQIPDTRSGGVVLRRYESTSGNSHSIVDFGVGGVRTWVDYHVFPELYSGYENDRSSVNRNFSNLMIGLPPLVRVDSIQKRKITDPTEGCFYVYNVYTADDSNATSNSSVFHFRDEILDSEFNTVDFYVIEVFSVSGNGSVTSKKKKVLKPDTNGCPEIHLKDH